MREIVDAPSDYATLCGLLNREYGVDLAVMSGALVERRIQEYCAQHGLASLGDCLRLFERQPSRLQEIADLVYSQTTHFNRSPNHFSFLVDAMRAAQREQPSTDPLSVWCLGCSTGQEPYTIAIYLMEHVFTNGDPRAFHVEAGDCSHSALDFARAGRYRIDDIARLDPIPYQKYSVDAGDGHVSIAPAVRAHVSFRPFNLVTSTYPPDRTVDAVFLRNAIDFHTEQSRRTILTNAYRILKPGGHLVVGMITPPYVPPPPSEKRYRFEPAALGIYRATG